MPAIIPRNEFHVCQDGVKASTHREPAGVRAAR